MAATQYGYGYMVINSVGETVMLILQVGTVTDFMWQN